MSFYSQRITTGGWMLMLGAPGTLHDDIIKNKISPFNASKRKDSFIISQCKGGTNWGWGVHVWSEPQLFSAFVCYSEFISRMHLKRNLKGGFTCGFGGCEVSRPAVLQMSWAVHYQVYVTWDYPSWHPLKANSQQYSWGGIWWRACICVCVYVCVHAFRSV